MLKKSKFKVVPHLHESYINDTLYTPAYFSLKRQLQDQSISGSVDIIEQFPRKTMAFLVCILDENSLVPDDYVARLLAVNNIHRDMSMCCGPVLNMYPEHKIDKTESAIVAKYKQYKIPAISNVISCTIDDSDHFPPTTGCLISGHYYNQIGGYTPIETVRCSTIDNPAVFNRLLKLGPIIYSTALSTSYFVTSDELNMANYAKHFYDLGYFDGLLGKQRPNVINDIEYDLSQDEVNVSLINTCKCNYNVGYYEALAKNLIIC